MDPGRRSRSPQGDLISTRGGSDLYLPDQAGQARFSGASGRRDDLRQHGGYAGGAPGGHDALGAQGAGYNPHYTPMFPVGNHASPPTPSFIPVHGGEFGRAPTAALPAFAGSTGRDAPYAPPPRGRFPEVQGYGAVNYGPLRTEGVAGAYVPPGQQAERGDMFVAFLEADERSRQAAQARGGLEWPTHGGAPPPHREGNASRGMLEGPHQGVFFFCDGMYWELNFSVGPPITNAQGGHDAWFDDIFMTRVGVTGSAPHGPTYAAADVLSTSRGSTSTSWERGAAAAPPSAPAQTSRDDLTTIFGAESVARVSNHSTRSADSAPTATPSSASNNSAKTASNTSTSKADAAPAAEADVAMEAVPPPNPAAAVSDTEMNDADGDADSDRGDHEGEGDKEHDADGEQDVDVAGDAPAASGGASAAK